MFSSDIQERAQAILAARKATTCAAIDDAALTAATNRPVIVCKVVSNALGGLMGWLSGADYNSNKVGDFYNQALAKLLNATGSPAAQQFGAEEKASLQPMFDQQDKALAAKEAAMGITNSGAAKADYSDLTGNQSRTLAGAVAPLYQEALGSYGSLVGAMPGAQAGAYQQALTNFQNAVEMAATGGFGGGGGGGAAGGGMGGSAAGGFGAGLGTAVNPYTPDITQTPYGYYELAPSAPNANPYAGTSNGVTYT